MDIFYLYDKIMQLLEVLVDFGNRIIEFVFTTITIEALNIELPVLALIFGPTLILFLTAKIILEFIT